MISWRLSINGTEREAWPIYGDSLSVRYAKQNNEQFFRRSLTGELTFIADDFARILAGGISATNIVMAIDSESGGLVFQGSFYLTDCEVDMDGRTIKVTPSVMDDYSDILDCLDREYNLVSLAPAITPLQAMKRPVIQIYRPGYDKVGCILSGMYWEQDAKEVAEADLGEYSFSGVGRRFYSFILAGEGDLGGDIPLAFLNYGGAVRDPVTKDGYTITPGFTGDNNRYTLEITDSDSNLLWIGYRAQSEGYLGNYTMVPRAGQTGTLAVTYRSERMYCRLVCDVDSVRGDSTSPLPDDDITANTRNYTRVIGYVPSNAFAISDSSSTEPTEWGLMPDGNYYQRPYWPFGPLTPALRTTWDGISVWWLGSPIDWLVEQDGRKAFTLEDAYPLWSVISVLLAKNGVSLTFAGDAAHSDFFYGSTNPIRGGLFDVYLTPKSNLVSAEYEKAAQRGDISLRMLFDMLRDCFRVYWFIEDGKLRLEHIHYFMNGGSYSASPAVGYDLTEALFSRNGRPWSFGQGQYKYDKPDTYGRIEFGWMDSVTTPFNGWPIDILAPYVQQDNVEKVDITNFTSDIDYILLNPGDVSKDGFALLCAHDGTIPFVNFGDNDEYILQNGFMSFMWLQRYYLYDLPASSYEIDGETGTAMDTKRIRRQTVTAPWGLDVDLAGLVKTSLGNGQIQSLTINLQSLEGEAELTL